MGTKTTVEELIDVAEIWPETDVTIRLILARAKGNHPFVIWAETVPNESLFFSEKHFSTEAEARAAFQLLTDVLVEIRDPAIELLRKTPANRPQ